MAEEQDEIIIIEEADAAGDNHSALSSTDADSRQKPVGKNTKLFLSLGLAAILLGAGITAAIFLSDDGASDTTVLDHNLTKKIKHAQNAPIEPSELERMIEKANFLYTNGNQNEALKLYEKIALYSEAISQYNLGVVQLKEGDYASALENFKRSIANSENRCVSAINAAVCSLHLGQEKNFHYYIDLAAAYLPHEVNSPLYSYYYALINYYKENYLEALSALKHPTTNEYQSVQDKMAAKIQSSYGNFDSAINALENSFQEADSFSLGLMYANIGDLTLAKKHLSNAIIQNPKPIEENLALSFVYLKSGMQQDAGNLIKQTTDSYPNEVYTPYPIKIFLKPSLFNPDDIQRTYRSYKAMGRNYTNQLIFYYAPYKIFNADQTISFIRKGNANIFIDDVQSAKEYLQKSARASSIDYGITLAIQKALNYQLRDANVQLNKLLESYPQHSILHYNLGLTYAQLGDFSQAYDHFLKSYHLDANNYLSGILAIMSAELISKSNPKLASIVKENLSHEPDNEEFNLYRTLIDLTQNNIAAASHWLDNNYKERPLYLALSYIIASELGKDADAKKASEKLTYLQKKDIIPHLLYIHSHFKELKPKAYANASLNYLKKQPFTYNDLFFGPQITRERYVQMAALTGQLMPLILKLENRLSTTTSDTTDITNALALAYFYNQDFEKAYALYNQLIDVHKVRDERTLFLGAAASIGSKHYENAIALLELSKLKNPKYLESRYALGLLYMLIRNNDAANIQFQKMGNSGFVSKYFDFGIDTDKLAEEPKKYHSL